MSRSLAALALVTIACAGGCEQVAYHDVDPTIRLAGEDVVGPGEDVRVTIGFATPGGFASLEDDDRLRVIWGVQGGTWTMPTVRTRGLGAFVSAVCDVTTAAGERVGAVDARVKQQPSAAGGLEIRGFPIPIGHAPPRDGDPIDDLYGQAATIRCELRDDADREGAAAADVTLVEG